MNLNSMRAAWSLEDETAKLGPEETIEVCNAVIDEAERLIEVCEKEIEDREDNLKDDQDE